MLILCHICIQTLYLNSASQNCNRLHGTMENEHKYDWKSTFNIADSNIVLHMKYNSMYKHMSIKSIKCWTKQLPKKQCLKIYDVITYNNNKIADCKSSSSHTHGCSFRPPKYESKQSRWTFENGDSYHCNVIVFKEKVFDEMISS